MNNVIAVVVTYNRKKLLIECLDAIKNQTFSVSKIVVVDNNSTDGTNELFETSSAYDNSLFEYIKLSENIGGAGGFHEGFKHASKMNADWLWIMDDDTIPENTSLENFIKDLENLEQNKISFLASSVYGPQGESMNVPIISNTASESGYPNWYFELDKGLVKIECATFVSLLINNNAVKEIGLPRKDYFIWGDDTEYTLRLTRHYGDAYLSGQSKVLHKRQVAKQLSVRDEENVSRLPLYFYYVRNNLINKREYFNLKVLIKDIIRWEIESIAVLFTPKVKYRFKKVRYIQKGLLSFLFGKYNRRF